MDRVVPYLINLGDVIPSRSKATLLNEMAMALLEVIGIYGKSLSKLGKISKITTAFWPVRLIPLTDTHACVCSYLLNNQEKLSVGQFSQIPPKPDNIIKGADPESFLTSLRSYNATYLKKSKNFKRNTVLQEALFSTNEIDFFKSFLLNQYNLSSFGEPHFILEGDAIARSVNQVKITKEIYDFVGLKDVKMLDDYAQIIGKQCESWIQKSSQTAAKIKGTTADTREEEKQLAMLNKELQTEKERDLKNTPEELVKTGKYKINDKTGEFNNGINGIKGAVDRIRQAITQKDLFLLDEGITNLDLKYKDLGNSISRYKSEIAQLKKNLAREKSDSDSLQKKKISELERKIAEIQSIIDDKHKGLSDDHASAEDIVVQIKTEKQISLDAIEAIKDTELTNMQNFLNNYTIEIKTKNVVVGLPIFVFYFIDPNTNRTTERAPVLPILIEKGKVVRTKVKSGFRTKIRDMMNKLTPMINLVESAGEKGSHMEMKNLDSRLEDAINDLRIKKILSKKDAAKSIDVINNIVW